MEKALVSSLVKSISKPSIGSFDHKNLEVEDLIDIFIRYDHAEDTEERITRLILNFEDTLNLGLVIKTLMYYECFEVFMTMIKRI
jgi:hypothetical protein